MVDTVFPPITTPKEIWKYSIRRVNVTDIVAKALGNPVIIYEGDQTFFEGTRIKAKLRGTGFGFLARKVQDDLMQIPPTITVHVTPASGSELNVRDHNDDSSVGWYGGQTGVSLNTITNLVTYDCGSDKRRYVRHVTSGTVDSKARIITSEDGVTWTERALNSGAKITGGFWATFRYLRLQIIVSAIAGHYASFFSIEIYDSVALPFEHTIIETNVTRRILCIYDASATILYMVWREDDEPK